MVGAGGGAVGVSISGTGGHAVSALVAWEVGARYNAASAGGHVANAAVSWLRLAGSAVTCAMECDGHVTEAAGAAVWWMEVTGAAAA